MLVFVADEDVDAEWTADCAACNAADALLTLAATWLSWEWIDVEAAASAVESWRLSEDETEAAEEVMFAKPLLNSLIQDASTDSSKVGTAATAEVKLPISLTKSRGSTSTNGIVIAGFGKVLSACPQMSVSNLL